MKNTISLIMILSMFFTVTSASAETVYLTVTSGSGRWTNTDWYEYQTDREYASPRGFARYNLDEMKFKYDPGADVTHTNQNSKWWDPKINNWRNDCTRFEGRWWMPSGYLGWTCWEIEGLNDTTYMESQDYWAYYYYVQNNKEYAKFYHLYGWY